PCIILPVFWGLIYRGIRPLGQYPRVDRLKYPPMPGGITYVLSRTVLSLGHSSEKSGTRLFIGPLSFAVRTSPSPRERLPHWRAIACPSGRRFILRPLKSDGPTSVGSSDARRPRH